jgi:hypothetical protein
MQTRKKQNPNERPTRTLLTRAFPKASLFLAAVGRRARGLLQQLPARSLHQQRRQHLLRSRRLLPSDPETHADPSPGQAAESGRCLDLLGRPLRHRVQHGATEVLVGSQQDHKRDLRLHRHLAVERHRMRSRRHLRLHGKSHNHPLPNQERSPCRLERLLILLAAYNHRPDINILQREVRLQTQLVYQQQVRRHKQLGNPHFAHRRRSRRQAIAEHDERRRA